MAKKEEIIRALLYTIAGAGLVVVAITAPNLIGAIGQFYPKSRFHKNQVMRSYKGIRNRNLVSVRRMGSKNIIRLTKEGEKKLLKYKLEDLVITKPDKWDKKWRLVIFDIPEKFRTSRIYLSSKLKEIGFIAVQKSVWVFPYPCENEIDFLKEIYEVRPFVRLITAQSIDIESDLKYKFNLR